MILKGLGAKTSWSKIANCKVILLWLCGKLSQQYWCTLFIPVIIPSTATCLEQAQCQPLRAFASRDVQCQQQSSKVQLSPPWHSVPRRKWVSRGLIVCRSACSGLSCSYAVSAPVSVTSGPNDHVLVRN
jgi:hypothetical protein